MKIKVKIACLALFVALYGTAYAAHDHKEKEYQNAWCAKESGVTEYVLDDLARVDCLTDEYAIEFDFAPKWAEAIGQALYYSIKTGKKPGVVLIKKTEEPKNEQRLKTVADRYGIKVWIMLPGDITSK